MKAFKRNAIIVTVLLFACAAVYLNWSYGNKTKKAATAGAPEQKEDVSGEAASPVDAGTVADTTEPSSSEETAEAAGAGLFYTGEPEPAASGLEDYFAQVRLERRQARDEAAATLQTVASAEGAAQATVDEALAGMTRIAQWTAKEAELENLIRARGFIDCVVYLSEKGATVTVAAREGLSEASVARITDVIVNETEFTADKLFVVEIK